MGAHFRNIKLVEQGWNSFRVSYSCVWLVWREWNLTHTSTGCVEFAQLINAWIILQYRVTFRNTQCCSLIYSFRDINSSILSFRQTLQEYWYQMTTPPSVLKLPPKNGHEMTPLNTRARDDKHGVTIVLSPPQREVAEKHVAINDTTEEPDRAAWSGKM